jgi:hypothetical protein
VPVFTTARGVRLLMLIVALSVAPYVLFVVLPYFVNDLHRLPLTEVSSGRHDPKDLWPTTVPYVGGWLHTFGFFSAVFTPMFLILTIFGALVAAVVTMRQRLSAWGVVAGYVVVVLTCIGGVVFYLGPISRALLTWQLD